MARSMSTGGSDGYPKGAHHRRGRREGGTVKAHLVLSNDERDLMAHALGLHYSPEPYRNRYATTSDCDGYDTVRRLEERGLMRRGRDISGGVECFHVTQEGRDALRVVMAELAGRRMKQ